MIKYNITVKIESKLAAEWIEWMMKFHIPEILQTGYFTSANISILRYPNDEQGKTYSIQYSCDSITILNEYVKKHAARIESKQEVKFRDKFVTFSSVLEGIENFSVAVRNTDNRLK